MSAPTAGAASKYTALVQGFQLPQNDVAALQATAAAVDAEPEDEAADDMEGPAGGPVTTVDILTQATLRCVPCVCMSQ